MANETKSTSDSESVFMSALGTPLDLSRPWLDAYQRGLRLAAIGSEFASLGMKQWGRQMDYVGFLSGATRDHVQNCMSDAARGWNEASKLAQSCIEAASTRETAAS